MKTIVQIKEDVILINENGSYYELNYHLFDFTPRVGDSLDYVRDTEGRITKVILNNKTYIYEENTNGQSLSTISVVFGSLGFFPLIIIGSIVGIITGLIGSFQKNNYTGRAKIGLWISVGSIIFWIVIFILQ